MSIQFSDIPNKLKKEIKYEEGSAVYDKLQWPPKDPLEFKKKDKEYMGVMISVIDTLVILSLMIFIRCLKRS